MKIILLFFTLLNALVFSSCSNYIRGVHNQMDRESGSPRNSKKQDRFAMYRNKKNPENAPFQGQKYSQLSTSEQKSHYPGVQRQYRQSARPRANAKDFEDDDNSGSLWKPQGQENYLFAQNKQKRSGDIVVIKVLDKLKSDISTELKRSYPARPIGAKSKTDKKDDGAAKAAGATPDKPAPTEARSTAANDTETPINETGPNGEKIFDKISSVVIEEINDEYVLIRGKKEVLYRKAKRAVEVQALVARKDIMPDDSVLSDKILETNIMAMR